MAKNTPSMAKNQMRRCLNAVLDPHPSKADVTCLWKFFKSSCAYCGQKLKASERNGHIDHLIPHSIGGTNDIHNHALSCARCNGDEKREELWDSFLSRTVTSAPLLEERRSRIEQWMQQTSTERLTISAEAHQAAKVIVEDVLKDFDVAIEKLRELRRSETQLATED